jgi:hypothetical protein
MPFTGGYIRAGFGTWDNTFNTYCQTNTSASDYGTCYNVSGYAYFVQSDTTTYPVGSLPCEKAGNCVRFTQQQFFYPFTIVDNSSVGKQLLLYFVRAVHYSNVITMNCGSFAIGTETSFSTGNSYVPDFFKNNPISARLAASNTCGYDPVTNSVFNINNITGGYRINMEYYANVLGLKIIGAFVNRGMNNTFFAVLAFVSYASETSPSLIMPVDYDEYVAYNELRKTVGWSFDGVNQLGWNASDIINTARELFPDRAWAVYDDNQNVLYLYNLTMDYVPDWLIDKLVPVAIKVLKAPADAAVAKAWLDLLNERNAQIPPQAELP